MPADNNTSPEEDSVDDSAEKKRQGANGVEHGEMSTLTEQESETIELELTVRENVCRTVGTIEDAFGAESIRAVSAGGTDPASELEFETLTQKEYGALEAACKNGYFESPRESSATEIADSLNVSHSTYLRRLRAAQKALFEDQFE